MRLRVTSAPAAEPITLAEAKAHLKVEISDDDTLLAAYIAAAREYAEGFTGRACITRTLALSLDCWPTDGIELPQAPLGSVTSITYVDPDGTTQTLSASLYQVVSSSENEPARIFPAYGQSWPSHRAQPDAITITYTAGYGAASTSVDAIIRQAMLFHIGHLYENRQAVVTSGTPADVPMATESLLWMRRIVTIPR